jgi:16S rRNA (cytosine1402-N4)-methyltransferase
MLQKVVELLAPRRGGVYVDATVGAGGHAAAILEACGPDGTLIGIDRDREALGLAARELERFHERVTLVHANFSTVADVLRRGGSPRVDGLLMDLGISSLQLDRGERGFSFRERAPLDMRMDQSTGMTADELIRSSTEEELKHIIRTYGEERRAGRIARAVADAAMRERPLTTETLAGAVAEAVGGRSPRRGRIHPATRTFQALRMAVNREMEELEALLRSVPSILREGGRCVCIAYHSVEDRIVKNVFRELSKRGKKDVTSPLELVMRKPLSATEEEVRRNPRSRSARLRAVERRKAA